MAIGVPAALPRKKAQNRVRSRVIFSLPGILFLQVTAESCRSRADEAQKNGHGSCSPLTRQFDEGRFNHAGP
jgi:hypothetical protein